MSTELVQVLVLLGAAIAMFVLGRPRLDAVALLMIVLLPVTGVLDMNVKVGLPLAAMVLLLSVLLVPWLLPP